MNFRTGVWLTLIFLTACTMAVDPPLDESEPIVAPTTAPITTTKETAFASIPENPTINRRNTTDEVYRFNNLIPYDGIRPVYDPIFVSAEDAPYQDDELVMGLAWGGEAKAYPVTVLRFREMVNDEMAGIPTLVTW